MTVADLIQQLLAYPENMPVMVEGYESGWGDIAELRMADLVIFRKAHEWDGTYREAESFKHPGNAFHALLIKGRRGT